MKGWTSFDYLDHHARETPDRIAITGRRGPTDWARFRADAGRFAQGLAKLGVEPGRFVALSHPDPYCHWLLAIACESLGAVSASLAPDADLVLTEEQVAGFLAETGEAAGFRRRQPSGPNLPLRIIRTSGSTGMPKGMALTYRMRDHWIEQITAHNFAAAETRYYVAYPLTVNPSYYRMEACLRLGATVILGTASQDLVTYEATHCWLLPRDMATLLQGARGPWLSPRPLRMILGGGPVSAALHDQAVSWLKTPVQILYGINETGFIGTLDRDGAGTVLSGVAFKIVDEAGQIQPPGTPGTIAVRTSGMAEGYLDDAEASAVHFRDGWFFTDDIGVGLADGRFRIVGRRSETINLGGLKISPFPMEEKLRAAIPGLQEIVVTSILGPQGDEVCLAVVPAPSADRAALLQAIHAEIDPSVGQVWLRLFDSLPSGASGKVQRSALKDIFAAARPR